MAEEPHARTVFSVSDHTGLTAETVAHSLVARFDGIDAHHVTRVFIDTAQKVNALVAEINETSAREGSRPVVFSTLTSPELWRMLKEADALVLGLFEPLVDELSAELGTEPSSGVGRSHSIVDSTAYQLRLDAVDFSLITDDGLGTQHYQHADVIVVGVSRVGKTPTCLYLSMHYGIRAANFPLTEEDLDEIRLPVALREHKDRIYGLTIDPVRLFQIRQKRRPDSKYASLERCAYEVNQVERIFRAEDISVTDTTARSIEEITATIIDTAELPRRID